MIGDYFPTTQRARAIAIWMLGLPLGLGLANGAGGWILQNWGWRNAFYIAAIPGLFCAVAAIMMREPSRGTKEGHAVGSRRRSGNPYLLVLSIPTMWWVIASGALHNFNMYALGAFVAPFLVRFHHMTFQNAGWVAACVYGFSGARAAGAVAPLPCGEIMVAELRSLVGEAKGFNLRALEPFRADGLHTAMYIVPILAGFLAVVLFAASRTVKKDVANLQSWMRSGDATAKAS